MVITDIRTLREDIAAAVADLQVAQAEEQFHRDQMRQESLWINDAQADQERISQNLSALTLRLQMAEAEAYRG